MTDDLNPLRIAQFFAMPGASALVEAFSAIPPGPVRDSIVQHAQALAAASGMGLGEPPPRQQPQLAAPRANGHSPALEWQGAKPDPGDRQAYVSASMEGRIVERAMRGESTRSISESTGLSVSVIESYKAKARRLSGVVFPTDRSKPAKKKKGGRPPAMPLPEPPWWWEDPSSPIWDSPYLLPGQSASPEGTLAAIGPHDRRAFSVMTQGADKRGITLRAYIARRQDIIRRVQDGQSPAEAAAANDEDRHYVNFFLLRCGLGLMQRHEQALRERLIAERQLNGERGSP